MYACSCLTSERVWERGNCLPLAKIGWENVQRGNFLGESGTPLTPQTCSGLRHHVADISWRKFLEISQLTNLMAYHGFILCGKLASCNHPSMQPFVAVAPHNFTYLLSFTLGTVSRHGVFVLPELLCLRYFWWFLTRPSKLWNSLARNERGPNIAT